MVDESEKLRVADAMSRLIKHGLTAVWTTWHQPCTQR